ncbi:hypothetical protein SSX86_006223 [Deinandra increscens subsp. villosa]|uniref:Uncharacterized protein n=1 Tax=Deinandra increscens subsp. villosa TaxID=3103831 RepID=A0AAP0DRB0_9ASTR
MEQTLIYNNTTKPMSRCYSNPPIYDQNQEILIKESSNDEKSSSFSSQKRNPSHGFIRRSSEPTLIIGNNEEDDIEDEESEFKMGRLIRQASLNSSHIMSTPQQTIKVMTGSSSLQRYPSQKLKANQEKIIDMRKVESMKERNGSKRSMKIGKSNGGAPTIPGGWVDKGSSEDMKAQIKFWARAVAFNLHQEC